MTAYIRMTCKNTDIVYIFYVDVAISAPFGDQPGTVYIYVGDGGSGGILNTNPIQVHS